MIDHALRAVDGSPRLSAVGPTVNGHRHWQTAESCCTVTQFVFHTFGPNLLPCNGLWARPNFTAPSLVPLTSNLRRQPCCCPRPQHMPFHIQHLLLRIKDCIWSGRGGGDVLPTSKKNSCNNDSMRKDTSLDPSFHPVFKARGREENKAFAKLDDRSHYTVAPPPGGPFSPPNWDP